MSFLGVWSRRPEGNVCFYDCVLVLLYVVLTHASALQLDVLPLPYTFSESFLLNSAHASNFQIRLLALPLHGLVHAKEHSFDFVS